eukprot:Protomagalhaensia_sp_Gyna_25__5977@NODE_928_length_2402_cov_153_755819_g734_i0_p4_GENE_NODE_928_length_2402_cov_153_755819_g734_i0NODE_928_length_2402_cov_153_755819_g734_i0_p4_ORF_typecomplete_len103_score12_41Phage_holin_3_6/PF07332_11/0_0036Forkhead_N/PF08430_12/0_0185TM5TMR_LYT/PF07694_12/0_029Tetraspanin/PF00335_20/0_18_NODE_928_length_2402_cov_153_755819_g734_i08751183
MKLPAEAMIGGTAVAGSLMSTIMGYPTGLMGQAYWQNEAMLIGTMGAFGMLSIMVLGVVGVTAALRKKDRQLQLRLNMEKIRKQRKKDRDEWDRAFRRHYRF